MRRTTFCAVLAALPAIDGLTMRPSLAPQSGHNATAVVSTDPLAAERSELRRDPNSGAALDTKPRVQAQSRGVADVTITVKVNGEDQRFEYKAAADYLGRGLNGEVRKASLVSPQVDDQPPKEIVIKYLNAHSPGNRDGTPAFFNAQEELDHIVEVARKLGGSYGLPALANVEKVGQWCEGGDSASCRPILPMKLIHGRPLRELTVERASMLDYTHEMQDKASHSQTALAPHEQNAILEDVAATLYSSNAHSPIWHGDLHLGNVVGTTVAGASSGTTVTGANVIDWDTVKDLAVGKYGFRLTCAGQKLDHEQNPPNHSWDPAQPIVSTAKPGFCSYWDATAPLTTVADLGWKLIGVDEDDEELNKEAGNREQIKKGGEEKTFVQELTSGQILEGLDGYRVRFEYLILCQLVTGELPTAEQFNTYLKAGMQRKMEYEKHTNEN